MEENQNPRKMCFSQLTTTELGQSTGQQKWSHGPWTASRTGDSVLTFMAAKVTYWPPQEENIQVQLKEAQ